MQRPTKRPRLLNPSDGSHNPSKSATVTPNFVSDFHQAPSTPKPSTSDTPRKTKWPQSDFNTHAFTSSPSRPPPKPPRLSKLPHLPAPSKPQTNDAPKPLKILCPPSVSHLASSQSSASHNTSGVFQRLDVAPPKTTDPTTPSKPGPRATPLSLHVPQLHSETPKIRQPFQYNLHQTPSIERDRNSTGNNDDNNTTPHAPPLKSISTTSYALTTALLSSQGPTELADMVMQDALHNPHHQRVRDALRGSYAPAREIVYNELDRGLEVSPEKKKKKKLMGSDKKVNKFLQDGLAAQTAVFFEQQRKSRILWTKETEMALAASSASTTTAIRRAPPPKPDVRLRILKILEVPKGPIAWNPQGEGSSKWSTPGIALCRVLASPPSALDVRVGRELTAVFGFPMDDNNHQTQKGPHGLSNNLSAFLHLYEEMQTDEFPQDPGGYEGMVVDSKRKRAREVQIWPPWTTVPGTEGARMSLLSSRFLLSS